MQEYTVKINGGNPITVLANDRIDAVERALCYGSDAVEFLSNMFNLKGDDNSKK